MCIRDSYLASKNRFAEAIELEQKVYNFRKSEYGPSSNVTIASYYRFCNYFAKTNQYDSLNKYLNCLLYTSFPYRKFYSKYKTIFLSNYYCIAFSN